MLLKIQKDDGEGEGVLFGSKIVLNLKTNQQAQNIGKQFSENQN